MGKNKKYKADAIKATPDTLKVQHIEEASDVRLKKFNLLALLLSFEKYWSPYSLSDGSLYKEEVKEEAAKVVNLFCEIYDAELFERTADGEIIRPSKDVNRKIFIRSLKSWLTTDDLFPYMNQRNTFVNRERNYFQYVLSEFESELSEELGLPVKMKCETSSYEELFHKNVLKWAAQLPDEVVHKMDDTYIDKMSKSDTLVVVGDIRRSQDLMTYGSNPDVYREKIIEFMNKTRQILKDNCGLYDRFTGEGFIAYFNKYMCEQEGKDYYEMMLKSCREILEFSNPFFDEWVKLLRRIPEMEIGLCIGVDSGIVSFKDLNNQLFAIGDACVWATRMNSAGEKGDIILNNIPYQVLSSSLNGNNCNRINSVTKGGEHFSAYRLKIKNIHYVPTNKRPQEHREPRAIS